MFVSIEEVIRFVRSFVQERQNEFAWRELLLSKMCREFPLSLFLYFSSSMHFFLFLNLFHAFLFQFFSFYYSHSLFLFSTSFYFSFSSSIYCFFIFSFNASHYIPPFSCSIISFSDMKVIFSSTFHPFLLSLFLFNSLFLSGTREEQIEKILPIVFCHFFFLPVHQIFHWFVFCFFFFLFVVVVLNSISFLIGRLGKNPRRTLWAEVGVSVAAIPNKLCLKSRKWHRYPNLLLREGV